MSSSQEQHLLPPPKPKLSPLELRNTDLVSRLLAATPPYLYNMSLLPNTYFFSEMLRSFVQTKNEQNAQRSNIGSGFGAANANMYYGHNMRRSRKRAWNNIGRENILQNNPIQEEKVEKPTDKMENNEPWMIKSMRKNENNALGLTTNGENIHQKLEEQRQKTPKLEDQHIQFTPQENSSNLVLPPPPPIWYPPIYPTPPYGIDPLHFFIDLRVSGHIYDKHNNNNNSQGKEGGSNGTSASSGGNTTIVSPKEAEKVDNETKSIKVEESIGDLFRQKRHCSAFSVPNASNSSKNRSNDKGQTRFDVKSMGFDKSSNLTSTNYIMGNISSIYKNLTERKPEVSQYVPYTPSGRPDREESMNIDVDPEESRMNDSSSNNFPKDTSSETEEEKRKKEKDLRALIGLELVVDYMSHKKAGTERSTSHFETSDAEEEEMSSEVESVGSPQLEVVAVQDDA